MRRTLDLTPLPEFDPEIGRWLAALEQVRAATIRLVSALDQATLDWQGPDRRENAVSSLLYHVAYVEMGWLHFDLLERPLPEPVASLLPFPSREPDGRLPIVIGVALARHLERLAATRQIFLDEIRRLSIEEWRTLRSPEGEDYHVTPEWAVFHLIEHEAGHAAQMASLIKRAGRLAKEGGWTGIEPPGR